MIMQCIVRIECHDVSLDAKGLRTSSKLHCYVGLRIVTLSKNLIKYENRYSQIFNIGYRELHMEFLPRK